VIYFDVHYKHYFLFINLFLALWLIRDSCSQQLFLAQCVCCIVCVLAVLYELLYEQVFGMEQPVRLALEMIDSKPFLAHGTRLLTDRKTDKTR